MKVLLRRRETGEFFHPERWTQDRREAWVFQGSAQALLSARELRESDLELILVFDDPEHDLRLPLPRSRSLDTE